MLAAVLLVLDLLTVPGRQHPAAYLVLALVIPVPVIWRRVYPRASAAALLVVSIADTVVSHVTDELMQPPALLAVGIMLYTVVAYVGRREGLMYLAALVVDGLLVIALLHQTAWTTAGYLALYYALCWTLAEFLGARHAYDTEVAAR